MPRGGKGLTPATPGISDALAMKCKLMLVAASRGELTKVQELITTDGCPVEYKNVQGETVLWFAVGSGNVELAQWLVTMKNADITVKSKCRITIAHQAAASGNKQMLEYFFHTPSLEKVWTRAIAFDGNTPLHAAVLAGKTESVRWLLAHKQFKINALDNDNHTPLFLACGLRDRGKMARMLVEAGADVNKRNVRDETALHNAARRGDLELCSYLIQHGGKIWCEDCLSKNGNCPVVSAETAEALRALTSARKAAKGGVMGRLFGAGRSPSPSPLRESDRSDSPESGTPSQERSRSNSSAPEYKDSSSSPQVVSWTAALQQ